MSKGLGLLPGKVRKGSKLLKPLRKEKLIGDYDLFLSIIDGFEHY